MEENNFSIVSITHSSNIPNHQIQIDEPTFLSFIKEGGTYIFKGVFEINSNIEAESHFYYYRDSISSNNELHRYHSGNIYNSHSEIDMVDEAFYKFGLGNPYPGSYLAINSSYTGVENGEDIITIIVEDKNDYIGSVETKFNNNNLDNIYFNNNNINIGYLNNKIIFRKTLIKDFINYDANGFEGYLDPVSQGLKYGADYIKLAKNKLTSSDSETITKTFTFDPNGGTTTKSEETLTTTKTIYCDGWTNTLELPSDDTLWSGSYLNEEYYDIENESTTMYAKGKIEYDSSVVLVLPTAEECVKENAVLLGWNAIDPRPRSRSSYEYVLPPGSTLVHWYEDNIPTVLIAVWDEIEHFIISHKAINESEWTVESETTTMSQYYNKLNEIEEYYGDLGTQYDLQVEYIPHNN